MPSYFQTPNDRVYPPEGHMSNHGAFRRLDYNLKGRNLDANCQPAGTDANTVYRGGKWNGPLTDQQIATITAAGYGARIVTVSDPSQLGSGLP